MGLVFRFPVRYNPDTGEVCDGYNALQCIQIDCLSLHLCGGYPGDPPVLFSVFLKTLYAKVKYPGFSGQIN